MNEQQAAQELFDALQGEERIRVTAGRVEVQLDNGTWQAIEQPASAIVTETIVRSRRSRPRQTTSGFCPVITVEEFEAANTRRFFLAGDRSPLFLVTIPLTLTACPLDPNDFPFDDDIGIAVWLSGWNQAPWTYPNAWMCQNLWAFESDGAGNTFYIPKPRLSPQSPVGYAIFESITDYVGACYWDANGSFLGASPYNVASAPAGTRWRMLQNNSSSVLWGYNLSDEPTRWSGAPIRSVLYTFYRVGDGIPAIPSLQTPLNVFTMPSSWAFGGTDMSPICIPYTPPPPPPEQLPRRNNRYELFFSATLGDRFVTLRHTPSCETNELEQEVHLSIDRQNQITTLTTPSDSDWRKPQITGTPPPHPCVTTVHADRFANVLRDRIYFADAADLQAAPANNRPTPVKIRQRSMQRNPGNPSECLPANPQDTGVRLSVQTLPQNNVVVAAAPYIVES